MPAPVTGPRPAVALRAVRDDDLPLLFALRRDRALQSLLLTVPDGLDDAALHGWVARRSAEPGGLFRVVVDVASDTAVGFAQVSQVHHRNRTGYEGLALVPDRRQRGLGQATLDRLVATAREELGLGKLLAEVRHDNFTALRAHLRVGFRIVGTLRRHFLDRDGAPHDVFLLERLLAGD